MNLLIVLVLFLKPWQIFNWPQHSLKAFSEWKNEFNVHFSCKADENRAISNYITNQQMIDEQNKKYKNCSASYALGLWENSIFSVEENNKLLNGLVPSMMTKIIFIGGVEIRKSARSYFDWRDEGAVTPVRNQSELMMFRCSQVYVTFCF